MTDHEAVKAGVAQGWIGWLRTYPVSAADVIQPAIKEAVTDDCTPAD
jgi:hypothetical protein